jgi:acyl-CoA synthetase (NDP forming)
MGGDMRVVDDWEQIIEEEKVPVYHSPERAIRAVGTVLRWKSSKM